ncbi:urease accessory protein [Mariprofundus ferrooxydans]|nr:urease accessory protein [Mariprofundus ferrooxydans]
MMSVLLLGFLLGMRHAVEADHVAAVASMTTQSKSLGDAMRLGATWGLGHTLTLFLFGSIVLFTDSFIPTDMAMMLEFAVGAMLIALGVDVIRRMVRQRIHFHQHVHAEGVKHFHAHSHAGEGNHDQSTHSHTHKKKLQLRPLLVGMMHGMAGSAALIVLALQTVNSTLTGMLYIALFGLGSVAGMAVLATIIMIPLRHSAQRLTGFYNGLQTTIGIGTITFGAYVMYQIGVVEGLVI